MPPTKKLTVVACIDARLQLNRILGLEEGEAHVIRNADGVITDGEIRSPAGGTFSPTFRGMALVTAERGLC
jgi:carbonic anhydrase